MADNSDFNLARKICRKAIKAMLPYAFVTKWQSLRAGQNPEATEKAWKERAMQKKLQCQKVICDNFLCSDARGEKYFDFKGIRLPDGRADAEFMDIFSYIFMDTFLFHLYLNDEYDSKSCEILDLIMSEGPYCYQDRKSGFMVDINPGDIVLDAGAYIGDFSVLAAYYGGVVYAFEPMEAQHRYLNKTVKLNPDLKIVPVKKGLGKSRSKGAIKKGVNAGANYIYEGSGSRADVEEIEITSVDEFVSENGLERVDFIKADIEGHERYLLEGARKTLADFAPRLAICTYHRPDDAKVLESLILDANPAYEVRHLRNKLFACVPGKTGDSQVAV